MSFFCKKTQLESHTKVCQNKDLCNVVMLSEDTKILEYNQYQNSYREPFIIYADFECLTEKIEKHRNNPQNSSMTKVVEPMLSNFLIYTILSFKTKENKHNV